MAPEWLPWQPLKMEKILSVVVLVAAGCSQVSQFKERAAFELRCKEDDMVFYEIGKNTWGAKGCGRQATYQRLGKDWMKVDEKEGYN